MSNRSSFHIISKDAWRIITEQLTVKDLLQLRGTSRYLNEIVKSLNTRWFQAHQWFVSRKVSKSKVKSAIKCHIRRLNANCIAQNHPSVHGETWYERRERILLGIADGILTEADCTNKRCWVYKVPNREQEIPLDRKHYNPKRNRYIYWYLIECYRHYKHHEKNKVEYYLSQANQNIRQIKASRQKIEALRKQNEILSNNQAKLEEKFRLEKAKYDSNMIFEGTRINGYKGV